MPFRSRALMAGALLVLPLAAAPAAAQSAAPADVGAAAGTITAEDMRARITYLASDALKGRDTPSPGLDSAAAYIARELKSFGLQPGGDQGTFIQSFPIRYRGLVTSEVAFEARGARPRALRYLDEFVAFVSNRPGAEGEAVYLGTAGTAALNQLASQAQGKVVLVYLPGAKLDPDWQVRMGQAVAVGRGGAAGVIAIMDPEFPASAFAELGKQLADGGFVAPFPIFGLRYGAAAALMKDAGLDLDALRARNPTAAVPIAGTTLHIRTPSRQMERAAPNVVAILPGNDPVLKNEYVVFSAHMDHVGVGRPDARGDSIHNGADDNASGTAVVVEVAQAFASLTRRPARSLVFLLVSGEEKGLWGSKYFVDNPTVPLENIVANINLDMIGRNSPDSVVAIGQDYSSLGPLAQDVVRANPALKLVVAPDLWPEEGLFFRSDHYSFAAKGVPALFFTTGLHPDYHRPSDEVEAIDADKAARIGQLAFYFGEAVASRKDRPAWTEKGKAEVRFAPGN